MKIDEWLSLWEFFDTFSQKLIRTAHQQSHPDKEKVSELDHTAQLNIKADALTTQGLNTLESRPMVPIDPTSEVLLHHRGQTIMRDYKVSIWNNIQLLVLEKYYQERFGLTNKVYGKIEWDIFPQSIDKSRTKIRNRSSNFVCRNCQ